MAARDRLLELLNDIQRHGEFDDIQEDFGTNEDNGPEMAPNDTEDVDNTGISLKDGILGVGFAFLLMAVITVGVYIHSFPANVILPFEEVEQVSMICRPRSREEVYQNRTISKINVHRTLCTFNIFHYDLRNRNKTYFALDVDIDIGNAYGVGKVGKLFTIKLFHLNKQRDTHHKQRNIYWSVSWCYELYRKELALCLNDINYKTETTVSQKLISTVSMGEKKRVSFLFLVDNIRKIMDIFSPIVLWKDIVFLEHYYEQRSLSVWISLADSNNDKYVSAKIRSGTSVKIGDLPNPAIVSNYEIIKGVMTYPFRSLFDYLWATPRLSLTDEEIQGKEKMYP
ncbi:uncharacterized protein LOC132552350 [Ylistrum balloti]|uniref:uncharacterized protein LOC132552350 n=1 Tax=Ylistrum balloti TaxID=509963 RepID=UPI002905D8E6|nr:uncharacterized protein LOC132552350 [Ylistrum balloti]